MVESKSKKILYFLAFVLPCLILYAIFFITPFVRGIGISFTNWDGLTPKTPIILDKESFESRILYSSKLNRKDRNYLMQVYSYDDSSDSYKRIAVSGLERYKLERIVKKSGFQPEFYKFVGLDNYKKIFSGKVNKDFYPYTEKIHKFSYSSQLPGIISADDFEKEVLKGAEKNNADAELIKTAYAFENENRRYKLLKEYDEYELFETLWNLPEVCEKKTLSENDLDYFIRELKEISLEFKESERESLCSSFISKNKLSKDSSDAVYAASDGLIKINHVKSALAAAWIIKSRNMGVIGFTAFFAVFSVIGINILAFALALALDSGIRGQKILRTVFFLPNVLSMIIVALLWSMLFVQLLPAITGVEKWISDPNKTPWLLVLVAVWQGCGYYMIVYLAGLQNISSDVIEAAKIDGATGWQRFRYITLPLMIPSLTISLFLTIANALKSFDLIYAMIGQTGYTTGTVPFVMDIYFDAFSQKLAGLASAKAMVLLFVIVLITGVQLYTMKRKEIEA